MPSSGFFFLNANVFSNQFLPTKLTEGVYGKVRRISILEQMVMEPGRGYKTAQTKGHQEPAPLIIAIHRVAPGLVTQLTVNLFSHIRVGNSL